MRDARPDTADAEVSSNVAQTSDGERDARGSMFAEASAPPPVYTMPTSPPPIPHVVSAHTIHPARELLHQVLHDPESGVIGLARIIDFADRQLEQAAQSQVVVGPPAARDCRLTPVAVTLDTFTDYHATVDPNRILDNVGGIVSRAIGLGQAIMKDFHKANKKGNKREVWIQEMGYETHPIEWTTERSRTSSKSRHQVDRRRVWRE